MWLHMYMPACVHMCQMCVCICVCMNNVHAVFRRVRITFEHDCVHVHTACMHTCTYACVCVSVYVHHVCVRVYVYECMCVDRVCVCACV